MKFRSAVLVATIAALVVCPQAARALPPNGPQLMSGWAYEANLTVSNNAAVTLPSGYTVSLSVNTAALIAQTRMRSDCADLRILFVDGAVQTELDRLVEGCNTTGTIIRFRAQAAIAIGAADSRYRMDYGNSLGTGAPENPANVYAFYDDFQDGNATGWTTTKGTFAVVNDGGNYIYRYTTGGAVWALSYVTLSGVSDLDYTAKLRAAVNTSWIGLAFRIQNPNNFLTFYESKDVLLFKYARIVADNHSILGLTPDFVMTAGTWYRMRVQAIGSTLRSRIWQDGTTEPTGWTISYTDAMYQAETNIGATLYNHTTAADWDDIQVRRLVAVEPTVTIAWANAPWWDAAWGYRLPLTVNNTSASATLPVRYSAKFTLDTNALIAAGEMLPTCGDLRVLTFDGITSSEIDRVVSGCNTNQTEVWVALQRPIGASGMDIGYYAYYGNPTAGAPLANGMNVFLFYEDFEQGVSHWTSAGGLDTGNTGTMGQSLISSEQSVSPSNSQKFPQKAGGGDAFSGYIPVTASTGYAIRTWARAASSTYFPVGFDPYNSAKVKGTEVWLWANEWSIPPQWATNPNPSASGTFTTSATTAYIKIKSEWWAEAPGSDPVYMDDLFLRYWIANEPTVVPGSEETSLVAPEITNIHDTGPVQIQTSVDVFADVAAASGTVDTVTLKILSPVTADVVMSLISGNGTAGTWKGSYTPVQGGSYSYRILAHSTAGPSRLSASQSFTASDTTAPVITPVSVIDPILVKNMQTVVVEVTDNGVLGLVTVTTGGSTQPMTRAGNQYSYSWQVTTVGTIAYTVTATDSVNNTSTLNGSFDSRARDVDVCTWKGCKVGAASWSNDDANSACKAELEAAGFRGTYYANVSSPQSWFTTYSAAGHEIGSHTVGHPCDSPCCTTACSPPNCPLTCTPTNIWQCPFTAPEMTAFRTDQFEPNIEAIETATGLPVLSGAWPCGCTDARRMTAAQYYFLGVRGYMDCGIGWVQDVNETTPPEFMDINGLHHYDQTFIDRAINEGKWTVVTAHGGCTGIDYMGSRSDALWLAPVGHVLKYIKVRDAAQLSNYARAGRTIAFDAVHNLPDFVRQNVDLTYFLPIVFDNPVTLKVHVLDSDQLLNVRVNDVVVPSSLTTLDGAKFVLFDAPLKTASHVVVTLATAAPTIGTITDNSPVELGASAQVTAVVTITEGTVQSVTLHVLAPQPADYPMTQVPATNTYAASFVPGQVASYSYQVVAANGEGTTSQSGLRSIVVQDTTSPEWRNQTQDPSRIPVGGMVTVSAQGRDLGGLKWAILETNESGSWEEFNWPISNWWNHSWAHRRPVTITESAGLARTAETIDLAVSDTDFAGLASCANELRVADTSGVEVPSQVYGEQNVGGVVTCRLLFQASVAAGSGTTYFVYYGNPSATPPSYATDLSSATSGIGITVQNSFFDVFLDADSGILSRVRLPQGGGTNLPLSTEANSYWGWHQVCSGAGNLTGKNGMCIGGTVPAAGLVPLTTLDGPIAKEFSYTIVRGAATYAIAYRFSAGAPSYHYTLSCAGTGCAAVMNNAWLLNGSYAGLGDGVGGTPSTTYNTYDSGTNHVRMASFASVAHATIDGTDNDGSDLGGTDYFHPTATGLDLYVATAASQSGTEGVLARIASPLVPVLDPAQDVPEGRYGSPVDLGGAAGWTPSAFVWSNPAIANGTTVQWRVKYCDLIGNCAETPAMSFLVQNAPLPTTLSIPDDATGAYGSDVWVPISVALPSPPDTPNLLGIDLAIHYDPAVLTPLLVEAWGAAAGFAIEFSVPTPGTLLISEYSAGSPVPYPGGDVARIKFHVAGGVGSQSALTFTSARLNEVPVDPANRHDGHLTVTGGIGGRVFYYRHQDAEPSTEAVPGIGIRRTQGVTSETFNTDAAGAYSFTNLFGTMTVEALGKHEDPPWSVVRKAAISSTDAAHASFAAVGSELLSINQFAAADVTGNGTVSALDASYIARFSVELVDHFPVSALSSSDWKLLRCTTYGPPENPGCVTPVYEFPPTPLPKSDADFYAILYGDVTGNWTASGSGFTASRAAIPSEEDKALIRDRAIADQFRRDGAPPVIERRPGMRAAELSLTGWKPLRVGERAQLTVDLRNADGILGLDLVLRYDPTRLAIVGVQAAGIGSALTVARADQRGTQRIAAYGYAALSGSGSILTITVEGLNNKGPQQPPTIGGVANEGAVPLEVRGRREVAPTRR